MSFSTILRDSGLRIIGSSVAQYTRLQDWAGWATWSCVVATHNSGLRKW